MIHNITPSVYYNYWWKHLNTQLSEPTNQNSLNVSNDVEPTNKKNVIIKL